MEIVRSSHSLTGPLDCSRLPNFGGCFAVCVRWLPISSDLHVHSPFVLTLKFRFFFETLSKLFMGWFRDGTTNNKVARDVRHIMSHIHTWQFRLLGQMKQPAGLHLGGLRRLRSFARHCIVCGELPQWRHAARTCRWLRIGHFSPHANSKDVAWIDLEREGIDSDGAQNRSDIKRCWFTEPPRSQGDKAGTLVDYVTGQMERVYPGDLQRVFAPGGRRVGHAWTMLVFVTQKQYCIQYEF